MFIWDITPTSLARLEVELRDPAIDPYLDVSLTFVRPGPDDSPVLSITTQLSLNQVRARRHCPSAPPPLGASWRRVDACVFR